MRVDTLWRAMIYAMRNQAERGLKLDNVAVSDMRDMQRTLRHLGKPGSPTVTVNFQVIESMREINYRPVVNNAESKILMSGPSRRTARAHATRAACSAPCASGDNLAAPPRPRTSG